MAIPHKNYYPPAGTVEVAGDRSWSWDGRAWHHNGRVAAPPRGSRLVGKPGTVMAGWWYDWNQYAWMDPHAQPAPHYPPGGGGAPIIHINPTPHPAPQPHPQPQPQPVIVHQEEEHMECKHDHHHKEKEPGLLKGLLKHPIIPGAGVLALIIPHFIKEPTPPPITSDTPPWLASLYQTIYDQNRDKYRDSRETWNNVGQALLTLGSAQAAISQSDFEEIHKIVEMLRGRKPAAQVAQATTHPGVAAGRAAM